MSKFDIYSKHFHTDEPNFILFMHTLFINPIGKNITINVFDTEKRTVIEAICMEKTWNDFEVIPGVFVDLAKKYTPDEIWCITGPWTFTLMRIITLILNSIAYNSPEISLKSCHYFDLIDRENVHPILEANRHEFLVRESDGNDTLIKKEEILPRWIYTGYIDEIMIPWYTPYEPTSETILNYFSSKASEKRLSPIYIKAPNITLWSKKISPLFS